MKHFSVGSRSRSRALIYVLAWVCLVICAGTAHAAVWYVDKDNASGVEDGRSWETAYRTIQPAIDAAHAEGGGDVWVAEGVYDEERISILNNKETGSLLIYNNINIYGGFNGNEISLESKVQDNKSIISGTNSCNGMGSYGVAVALDNCILNSFILTGTNRYYGGSALYVNKSANIFNCDFKNNTKTATNARGAAISAHGDNGNISIKNCLFLRNNADDGGGAISIGYNQPTIIDACTFVCNNGISVTARGGSISPGPNATITIKDSLFINNKAYGIGALNIKCGGVYNSSFIGNCATGGYAGAASVNYASNCIFWGNRAEKDSGAISVEGLFSDPESGCYDMNSVIMSNCTFSNNYAGTVGGAMVTGSVNMWNCILWDDYPNEITPWDNAMNYVNYSLIEGGVPDGMQTAYMCNPRNVCTYNQQSYPTGMGILDQDPKFVTGPSGMCTGLAYDAEAVQSVLTDSGASFTPGAWKGAYLGVSTGANEYWYYIIDNDATTLRVWADATEGGTVSAPIAYEVMTHRLAPDSPCIDAGANTTIACYGGVTTDIEGKQRGLDGDGVDNALAGDGSGYDIGAWEYPEAGCGYGLMFEREFAALVKALPDLIGPESAAQLDADPATLDFENGAAWLAWVNSGGVGLEPALGDGVPDLWQLRLMAETFCAAPAKSGQDAWLNDAAAFRDTYLANRELWVTKIESLLRTSMPAANRSSLEYVRRETSRVYPALLSISGATRDAYLALLSGLDVTGNYTPITWPGKTVLEPFSGTGDLDRDGRDNATEYDDVISAGGDVDNYIQQAGYNDPFWPGNPAIPVDPWTLTALTLSLAICASRRLGQRQ